MPRLLSFCSFTLLFAVAPAAALAQGTPPPGGTAPAGDTEWTPIEEPMPGADALEPVPVPPEKDAASPGSAPAAKSDAKSPAKAAVAAQDVAASKGGGAAADVEAVELMEPTPEAAPQADTPESAAGDEAAPPAGHGNLRVSFGKDFTLSFDGKLRVGYSTFTPDRFFGIRMPADQGNSRNPYVGRNDGFGLADARLNLRASYKDLHVRIGFDGAFVTYADEEDTVGALTSILKDAYFGYTFHRAATLTVGRFKPPYDIEALMAGEDQYFVHEAIESRGVDRHEGYNGDMPGFDPERQMGLMVGSDDFLDMSLFEAGYAVAITNGKAIGKNNPAFNDNDLPALFVRLHGGLKFGVPDSDSNDLDDEGPATVRPREGVFAGIGFMFDERTTGNPPNRQRDQVFGVQADIMARLWYIVVQGQIIYEATDHLTFDLANSETALGGHAQISVEIPGLGLAPGYRFAAYDPRIPAADVADPGPDDELVMHHTIGLRWAVPDLPLVAWLEYTHSEEQASRAVPNDRILLAAQVTFE